jgi:hypothetical protein
MKIKDFTGNFRLSKEIVAIIISLFSLLVSGIGFYLSTLKPPNIDFVTAPYIKHIVDNASFNEAFFIPVTISNQGARSGTVLSFELNVTNLTNGKSRTYFGQYFTKDNSPSELGNFFTPITVNGYSSLSKTVCFYPIGITQDNLFSEEGKYDFNLKGEVSNENGGTLRIIENTFQISANKNMEALMLEQPDGEYIFPLPVEANE